MSSVFSKYEKFIEARLEIINKQGQDVPFVLNSPQKLFIQKATGKDIILKARQQGFSSLIGGMYIADFLLDQNSHTVVVADNTDNAIGLLDRVKYYLGSYERRTGVKIPLKYNSKYELQNEVVNSKYQIGTAENTEFGRSKTIKNLHFSEAAFYKSLRKMLAGADQAVRPDGKTIIETTANGFNEFKEFWDDSVLGNTGFNALFFKASLFYSQEFLEKKKQSLKELFQQEYPETPEEAFITSGQQYFDRGALQTYLKGAREPLIENTLYGI